MQTSFVLIKTCMYVPPGFRKWPFNTHNKNNFLNCDFYYVHKAADTREGKRKDNYRFTPEIHTGYFLPDCSSHLKSLVANWIPSTAESKWSFCNKRKKRFCWNTTIAQTLIVAKSDLWIKKFIYLRFTKPVSLSYSAVGTFWNNWKGTERKAENRKCRGKKIKNERKMEKRKKIWMSEVELARS